MLIYILPDQALYQIPFPWIYLTLALQLVAAGCLLASLLQTGAIAFLGLDPILRPYKKEPVEHLVRGGFFAWTRHPIYFFTFIILWLFPVMTWNLIALIIGITAYTMIGSLFEERKLAIQFGEEYLEYKRKTPWIVPIRLK